MNFDPNMHVNMSVFIDKEDGQVGISVSVQADAALSLESLKKVHPDVQVSTLVELLQADLDSKLYVPLRQLLNERLKGQS